MLYVITMMVVRSPSRVKGKHEVQAPDTIYGAVKKSLANYSLEKIMDMRG